MHQSKIKKKIDWKQMLKFQNISYIVYGYFLAKLYTILKGI